MSSYFLKSGSTFRVSTKESMDLHEQLPAGNYTIKMDQFENFFFEHIESFNIPSKLYGVSTNHTDRIISTFMDRQGSTGVLLAGEKGSGKTLLTKNISIQLAKKGVPTIVINQAWCGEKFNTLIQQIEQPAVILFDEFEKVYNREDQEKMLTLLDGVYSSKKLFLLTTNDKWRIDSHMRNRPGRIYYMLDFKGLDSDFVREYCEDNLWNKSQTDGVVNVSQVFSSFNFDMMKALVEEMNRYNETPRQAMTMLNVRAEYDNAVTYSVEIIHNEFGKPTTISPTIWNGIPLNSKANELCFSFVYKKNSTDEKNKHSRANDALFVSLTGALEEDLDEEGFFNNWKDLNVESSDLVKMDIKTGRFIFVKDSFTVILTRMKEKTYNFDAF